MKRVFTLIFIVILLCTGCTTKPEDDKSKPNIVCTVFPQYDFVREIAQGRADVYMLLPPGGEAHSYEPSPEDILLLDDADLFIMIGGESEHWAMHLIEGEELKDTPTLKLYEYVNTYREEVTEGMETSGHDHKHEHTDSCNHGEEKSEFDEHIWTSPQNAIVMCNVICDKLCAIDPDNESFYRKNAAEYCKKLAKLDNDLKDVVANSESDTIIFGDRFPMRYLVEDLKLTYYAAFPGCSSKTEPSAKTIAFLSDKVKEKSLPAVLYMDYSDGRIADTIARESNAKSLRLYSCHNLSREDFEEGKTYIELMYNNLSVLKEALN